MGRKPRFETDRFLDAALKLLHSGGPAAVTVAGIAESVGAPVGSVYHRFPSRDVILAELWMRTARAFQDGFLEMLGKGNAVEAALYTVRWSRSRLEESRLLLLYRREDLTRGNWPAAMKNNAADLEAELGAGLREFAKKRFGRVTKRDMERTVFALVDVPLAAVLRHVQASEPPPESVDEWVRKTCRSILEGEE